MKVSGHYRRRHLRRLAAIAVSAAIGGSFAATPAFAADSPPAQGVSVLYSQDFTGTSTQAGDWIAGGKACLTAAKGKAAGGIPACNAKTPDKAGSGALSLTGDGQNESGFVLYQHPLTAGQGADIQFDMYQYDSLKTHGADGMSFFLVDGSASPTAPGQPGGGLGYAGSGGKPGLKGGILAVGFDEYGNFSVAGDGHKGGTKKPVPDAVVARGSEATQYAYIDGKTSPVTFWFDSRATRADAKVHVEIKISPANDMTVLLGGKVVLGPLDLSKIPGQPPLPATFKFGFAASTGGATAIHDLSGLSIATLPPSLTTTVSHSGDFTAGGTGTITVGVGNAKTAGPTDQLVTTTIPVPAGLTATAASGTGWTCDIGDGQVTCTRSDMLKPGASYPPIAVTTSVAPSATGTIPVTASAGTAGQQAHAGSSATDKIVIQAVPLPHVTTSISPVGSFTSPGTATYQANVTDGAGAGPVTGTTKETFDIPAGQTVSAATGDGWTCTTSGQRVTCTTSATAQPGGSLPPVTVTAAIPSGATSAAAPTATVTTAGQASPSSAPAVSIPVTSSGSTTPPPGGTTAPSGGTTLPPAAKPAVTTTISAVGTFTAPGTGTYQANVTATGPTTGTTTEVITVPSGQTVTSATGDGWTCLTSGQQVTCTTQATAQRGASLPPVSVVVSIPGGTAGPLSPTATATTDGQSAPSSAPAVSIPVTPAIGPPSVMTAISPVGTFTSPGTGGYQATVSADQDGGPTTGTTTQVFTVPAGQTVTSATGDGWNCTTSGQQVTCTTSAKVQPGGSFPPVTIAVGVAASASASVSPTATVTTAGQQNPSSAPPVSIPVTPIAATGASTPARAPDLSAKLAPKGALVSGQDGTLDLIVSNAAKAGPTTGTVTASYTVPNGSEVTKAAGDGWSCKVQRWLVSCTRPGDGKNALAAGASYPPVALTSTLCQRAVCTLAGVTVQVSTPGDAESRGSTLTEDIAIQRQSSVQVTMISTPNPAVPGQPVTYTATISNAGPTDAAGTQLAIAVPFGFFGQWSCKASPDSACAEPIGTGSTTVTAYIAAGGTVTLTATGPASSGAASTTVSLTPGYTDAQCGQTCTATVP
jgi:uncharacterized repeat protein (TIGR01451 family)